MAKKVVRDYTPRIELHDYTGRGVFCRFYILKWARGCPAEPGCRYCWLHYGPYMGEQGWNVIRVAKKRELARAMSRFWRNGPRRPILLNAGELSDSFLGIRGEYDWWLAFQAHKMNMLYGRAHKVLFLTKMPSLASERFMQSLSELADSVVCSASLNIEGVAREYEPGTDPPRTRIEWLAEVEKTGVETRARIDPIVLPWLYANRYLALVDELASKVEGLRVVTLGVLRASTQQLLARLPSELQVGLVKGGWGFTYTEERRAFIYSVLTERLKEYGVRVGLCKETPKMWRAVGAKGPCNCIYMLSGSS